MASRVRRSAACAVAFLLVGCSGDDPVTDDVVPSPPSDGSDTASTDPLLVAVTGEVEDLETPADDAAPTVASDAAPGTVDSIEPVPDTGVPGIDSADDFCRSWSEYAGSYQAITFGWAFRDPLDAARLEVSASGAIIEAAAGLGDHLPAELEDERVALTVDLVTPLVRRASRAADDLAARDVDPAARAELRSAWLATLAESGTDDAAMTVPIPDSVGFEVVDEVAGSLLTDLPPIVEDPSLIVDVQIPTTEVYLAENCPDQGVLSGNDVVE